MEAGSSSCQRARKRGTAGAPQRRTTGGRSTTAPSLRWRAGDQPISRRRPRLDRVLLGADQPPENFMTNARSPFIAQSLGRRLILLCLFATACAPVRMAVPSDVGSASDEIPISDRSSMSGALVDESFKMGPYKVVDVSRKWNSSSKSSFLGL